MPPVVQDEGTSATVEQVMYSITVSDPAQEGNPLVFVSPGFETLTGYTSEEVLGRNCKLLQVGGGRGGMAVAWWCVCRECVCV